jgi:hypothetical protein
VAQLFVLSGPDVGRSFEVKAGDTIGRSQDCILVLRDPSVSRQHAHLEQRADRWSLVDDGSRNGILVDGARTPRIELSDGMEFVLGEVLMRFRCEVPSEAARAPAQEPTAPAPPPESLLATRVAVATPRPPESPPQTSSADGEIVLEGAEEIDLTSAAAPPASAERSESREQLAEQRGRILQYHRVPETGSTLSLELAQLPAWKRYGLYLLALLLLAAAAAAAFFGAAFVKDRLGGGADATTVTEQAPGD